MRGLLCFNGTYTAKWYVRTKCAIISLLRVLFCAGAQRLLRFGGSNMFPFNGLLKKNKPPVEQRGF
jgi:hypothetical protein